MYFKDNRNPTMNELIRWFMKEHTDLVNEMMNSKHSLETGLPNPYHTGDTDIFCHTMLVCKVVELNNFGKVNKICALLHDIGKPEARTVIPFHKNKPGDDKEIVVKDTDPEFKVHFRQHESLSTFKAIPILEELVQMKVINNSERIRCLWIINEHGNLFNYIKDGKMHKPEKVFCKFSNTEEGRILYTEYLNQVLCDSLGRFSDDRPEVAKSLGESIYTIDDLNNYFVKQTQKTIFNSDGNYSSKSLTLLIGLPASGKSTIIKEFTDREYTIISRDEIVTEYAKEIDCTGPYNDLWDCIGLDGQKEVDKRLKEKFRNAIKLKEDVVIDMTNLTLKSRRKFIVNTPTDYDTSAYVFLLNDKELDKRASKRFKETGKIISKGIIKDMKKRLTLPNYSEFDYIRYIFE